MTCNFRSSPVLERILPFYQLIGRHLDRSLQPVDDAAALQIDEKWGMPKMYVPMMEALLEMVRTRNPSATVAQVKRADTLSSGHVDYQRKLALYCTELAEQVAE